ncbi:MAG TPA: chemotaxis protein CheA [Usitatibacter sp.]|jgi:two-component system chemotaxis sensor kinase CheA|nr:chemotaxis protein CheA [Usitatibacter sp.]
MPIDLNRFIATFFDEAQEHLESIEERAMALGASGGDTETLNAIFRAAHSIKGGSGTFGFTQLSEATHEMETLFDDLRKGRGVADESTVRLLLDACDAFKAHLARLKGGERGLDPAMAEVRRQLAGYRAREKAEASVIPSAGPTEESFFGDDEGPAALADAASPKATAYGLFDEAPAAPAAPAKNEKYGLFESDGPVEHNRRKGDQSSIRVSVAKIDRIVNLVGELVIAQAMMQQASASIAKDEQLSHSLATLDRNTRDLQQAVMSIRMMPMEFVFSRFPRLVYDVSAKLGKKVHLRTQGHDTELDKELIELLIDPLTHVVRNAIDHGIESPEERAAAGKPEQGAVFMRATHRGGSVIIEVSDDGRGLDRERILAKARELAMPVNEGWTDAEAWGLIFEAGFSTAREVTSLSGRGVGMDVVRRNIASLGGSVSVASAKGEGTTITIQVPLTLAVLDGMIVCVGDEQYIVPLEFVAEAFKPAAGDIRNVVGQPSLVAVRGEHLPIVKLDEVVQLHASLGDRSQHDAGAPSPSRPEPICLVVEVDNRRAALLVDQLVGQQQLVVKSLDTNLHSVPGVAGATILGDGRVALILDVSAVTRSSVARNLARTAA